nr:response regulator [Sphingomonas sp. Y57]
MEDPIHSAKILIVEDHVAVARSLTALLAHLGHRCVALPNAEEAAYLNHGLFDLALIDIVLPGENGFVFAERIAEQHPAVGIILMTGSPAHFHHPAVAPRTALLKPFRPRELQNAVADTLRHRRRSAAGPPVSLR